MGLKERLQKIEEQERKNNPKGDICINTEQQKQLFDVKADVHKKLIEDLDLDRLQNFQDDSEARAIVRDLVLGIMDREKYPISALEKGYLVQELENETFGLGPLEPLLSNPTIDEILVNGPSKVFVERFGQLERTDVSFKDEAHLRQIIDRIVSRMNRRIDEASPMVDARLKDGSRVNAIIPPLAIDGSSLSIRKFKKDPLKAHDLISFGSATQEIIDLLEVAVQGKLNILISGGTGTGKTTMLNILSSFIPDGERIITIEDAAELQLQQDQVVRLETRPANVEGKGAVTQRDLVKNSLRMRPDRIVVGEVRGAEALDMLSAMNTGHEGSLTTVHANTPRDALSRVETMVLMGGGSLTQKAINRQIASAFHLVVQITRYPDGGRRMSSMTEIVGMEGDIIVTQEIMRFKQTGMTANRKVEGHFEATGVKPRFIERFEENGVLEMAKQKSKFIREMCAHDVRNR